MRLYRIGALWRGTEADAKAAARETGVGCEKIEVPTDKPGLLAFLNQLSATEREVAATQVRTEPAKPRPGSCPVCDRTEKAAAQVAESQDLQAITDFILDRATPTQIEQLFASLGARFHELRKAAEAGR